MESMNDKVLREIEELRRVAASNARFKARRALVKLMTRRQLENLAGCGEDMKQSSRAFFENEVVTTSWDDEAVARIVADLLRKAKDDTQRTP